MSSTQQPRVDQIAELTRALDIPLPPIDQEILELILEAIVQAWEHVKTNHGSVLKNGDEAEISSLLETWLNADLSSVPGLELFVSSVDRGRETISFDGSRLEVRPDLSFRLTHLDARFRLIAECKIIDMPNGKTSVLYRDKGIARFVKGDYAWASREALMLGYVRCGSKLRTTMLDSLRKHPKMACVSSGLRAHPNTLISHHALGISKHNRAFSYVHPTSQVPGQIELWHLWLDV
jgi:hypothetical protein